MRICFLAAGNSVHSYRWIRYFAEKGHEIHWISLTPCEFPELPNTTFYSLGTGRGKWWSFFMAALRIRGLVRRISPDIVHAHYAGSYGLLGALSGFQPLVLTAWGSDILFAGQARIRGQFVRWVLRRSRLITCDAHHMVKSMCALGADAGKIQIVYWGIEMDRLIPGEKDPEILSRWDVQGKRVVISLRNLEPVYNIETLLDAIPMVVESEPDAVFVIAGAGTAEQALKDHASKLGLGADRVKFVGRYANADLPRMLRSSDVYVSTSLSDGGLAASTLEAMACGVPVVISNTGENDEWIKDSEDGFLVPAREPKAFAERIVVMLRDETMRKTVGLAGRAAIRSLDHKAEMKKVEELYLGLAGHP